MITLILMDKITRVIPSEATLSTGRVITWDLTFMMSLEI